MLLFKYTTYLCPSCSLLAIACVCCILWIEKRFQGLLKINFLPEKLEVWRSSDILQLIWHSRKEEKMLHLYDKTRQPAKRMKRENPIERCERNRKFLLFVILSIAHIRFWVPLFVCHRPLCAEVEREKDQLGKSIKPLLSLFEFFMWYCFLFLFRTMATNSPSMPGNAR